MVETDKQTCGLSSVCLPREVDDGACRDRYDKASGSRIEAKPYFQHLLDGVLGDVFGVVVVEVFPRYAVRGLPPSLDCRLIGP